MGGKLQRESERERDRERAILAQNKTELSNN